MKIALAAVFAGLALVAAQDGDAPTEPFHVRFARAREIAVVACSDAHVSVGRDGRRVAVLLADGRAVAIDTESGAAREIATGAGSIAVGNVGEGVWVGSRGGKLERVDIDGGSDRSQIAGVDAIDGLEYRAGRLAWSSRSEGIGGVIDVATGAELLRRDGLVAPAFAGGEQPLLALSPDGRSVAFIERTEASNASRRTLRVIELVSARELASAEPYQCHRGPGFVLLGDSVVYGTRTEQSFRIERFALAGSAPTVLDEAARSGHFIDLVASPSGRYLLEGDFEEDGARLYVLGGETAPPLALGGDGIAPIGFLSDTDGSEYVLTSATRTGGLALWSTQGGALLVEEHAAFAGRRPIACGVLLGGRRAWVQWWVSDGPSTASRLHLSVLALD